jgi:hypothetical protein
MGEDVSISTSILVGFCDIIFPFNDLSEHNIYFHFSANPLFIISITFVLYLNPILIIDGFKSGALGSFIYGGVIDGVFSIFGVFPKLCVGCGIDLPTGFSFIVPITCTGLGIANAIDSAYFYLTTPSTNCLTWVGNSVTSFLILGISDGISVTKFNGNGMDGTPITPAIILNKSGITAII